jgi:hypothetical protein
VFRNTVFIEEAVGSGVMLVAFVVAMLLTDLDAQKWELAELVSLSQGIYVASFLFLAVKLRGCRVSVPVVAAVTSAMYLVIALIAAVISGASFSTEIVGVLGISSSSDILFVWMVQSFCYAFALTLYLLALRFIPPLTVSVTLCVQSLSVQFISFLLFFNKSTAMWFLCPLSSVVPLLPTQAPTPEVDLMCAAGAPTTKNIMFSAGASVAVISGGYLVYISSIKRSKVDMLVKVLSNRKVPKNPYQSRSPREKRFLPQKRQLLRPANIRSASLSLLQQHWTGTTRSEFSLETLHQTPDKNDLDAPQNEGVITTTRQLQNHSFDS